MNNEATSVLALANDPVMQQMKADIARRSYALVSAHLRRPRQETPVSGGYLSMSMMAARLQRGEDVCIRFVPPPSGWPKVAQKPKSYAVVPVAGTIREGCHRYELLDLLDDEVASPIYDPGLFEGECGLYFASELLNSDNY